VLDLDHLAVDLWKQRLNLIDQDTERRRRSLGSRRPGTPQTDEETESDDPSRGPAHAGTDASISPEASPGGKESQGMGGHHKAVPPPAAKTVAYDQTTSMATPPLPEP